ncbi:MAG: vitamin K epoxide reductase family protein [Oscillatoria sp. PMC 1051.18]|nr:vitamin K epoxide reductase family protein [Oscillatoria sp. PMC 1050.18]MEC5032600.1 vitamin K epoxide reductase family protein [Oscillatoria sp. PMC 1051.18]
MKRLYFLSGIYNWSRIIIGAIAAFGFVETVFLTVAELSGKSAEICPTSGCEQVLESSYASILGIPISLFGSLAYGSVAAIALAPLVLKSSLGKEARSQLEEISWYALLAIATAMAITSAYLMGIMFLVIQGLCPYCITSALLSTTLFILTVFGHQWKNMQRSLITSLIVALVTISGVFWVYTTNNAQVATTVNEPAIVETAGESGPEITHTSGKAEIALANHLQKIGAKLYTAYTCPHCYEQKQLFGKEALAAIEDIECHPQGKNSQTQLCQQANLPGVPAWEINGKLYLGVQSLEKLAEISGYTGSQDFKYPFPYR